MPNQWSGSFNYVCLHGIKISTIFKQAVISGGSVFLPLAIRCDAHVASSAWSVILFSHY